MMSRLLGVLAATLALAVAAPLYAAPTPAAPADSITYHIERHNQQVTVKDANEKTLVICRATTPTLQGIFVKNVLNGTVSTDKKTPGQLRFMLEDQNGLRLWSTLVPVTSPLQVGFKYGPEINGSVFVVTHQAEETSDPNQPPALRLVWVMGLDGHPVSMSDGVRTMNFAINPTGISVTNPSGKVLMKSESTPKDGTVFSTSDGASGSVKTTDTGSVIDINGTQTMVKKVTKDGKVYSSFPWNGHHVLAEQPCSISVTSDGDLTVNAPSTANESREQIKHER